jgi:sulfite exporter TauE/SafE
MSGSEDDVERWQRISERQISARDPSTVRKQRVQSVVQRQRTTRKAMTTKDIVRVFSYKMLGGIAGLVLGMIAWIVLTRLVVAWWVDYAGLGAAVLLAALGVLIGASFDWRDDLRNF